RCQIRQIIRHARFALHHREIDLALIETARMHRRRHQYRILIPAVRSPGSSLAAVRRSAIGDPEDAPRRTIGLSSHRLVDEAVKWFNPGTRFAAPGQL